MVVGEVPGQDPAEMGFVEDEDVVQALAPHRTDQTLDEGFCQGDLVGLLRPNGSDRRRPVLEGARRDGRLGGSRHGPGCLSGGASGSLPLAMQVATSE